VAQAKSGFVNVISRFVLLGLIALSVVCLMPLNSEVVFGYQIQYLRLVAYVVLVLMLFCVSAYQYISIAKWWSLKVSNDSVQTASLALIAFNASYVAKPFSIDVFLIAFLLAIVIGSVVGIVLRLILRKKNHAL
jgi:uncharacterized membrane protein